MSKLPPMASKFSVRLVRRGVMALASVLLCTVPVAHAQGDAAVTTDTQTIRQWVFEMEKAYTQVQDYTATFYKQERVKGRLLAKETIQLKFRKPFSVYMQWTDVFAGREVVYQRGWNDDKIRAHQGSFPDVTVNLRPDSSLAMRGNRHPITQVGLGETINLIVRDARFSEHRPSDDVRYTDLGEFMIYGARSRCIEAITPSMLMSPYYAAKAKICFNTKTMMPTRVTIWDEQDHLLEDYGYANVQLNVGLTDADFSPDNPDYNF